MKFFYILSCLSIIIYACPSYMINDDCQSSSYHFDIPVTFFPESEIIPFGDTITVTSTFSRELASIETTEIFKFDSIDIRPIVTFVKLDTPHVENVFYFPYTEFIEFIADSSLNLRIDGNSIAFDYQYQNDKYFAQFKFIPKRKGIYYFEYRSAYHFNSNSEYVPIIYSINSSCVTNLWRPNFLTNEGNNHKYLLKESIHDYYKENVFDKWDSNYFVFGRHCFKIE